MIENRITDDPHWRLRRLCEQTSPDRRRTSVEFQRAVVELLLELTVDEVSRRTGVDAATLRAWRSQR